MGKKRKTWKHTRKVCWARKRKKVPPLLSSVYSCFIFAFTLSQFSGPNYLGAWNRLRDPRLNNCEQRYLTDSHWVQGLQFSVCSSFTLAATPYDHNWSIISDLHIYIVNLINLDWSRKLSRGKSLVPSVSVNINYAESPGGRYLFYAWFNLVV